MSIALIVIATVVVTVIVGYLALLVTFAGAFSH